MNFLKKIFKNHKTESEISELSDGYCPNCWGDQEYDDLIREKHKDTQINVNNHNANYAFVQEFIVTHLDGIKLKSSINGLECPTCKMKSITPK